MTVIASMTVVELDMWWSVEVFDAREASIR